MSANPKVPAAPQLRAIREAWLGRAIERLETDPGISAAGFVGSLGRGEADDWSDIDLLVVVPDDQVHHFADATQLSGSEQVLWSIDSRHNAPRGAGAVGVRYVIDGLPLHVDWYIYPRSLAAWVADAKVIFDPYDLPRLNDTVSEYQEKREVQPPTPKPANAHRLLQVSLIPVAPNTSCDDRPRLDAWWGSSVDRTHPRPHRRSTWRCFAGCSSSIATTHQMKCWPPPVAISTSSKLCCRRGQREGKR
jgi:predicted nucleotidyltransferase